MDVQPYINTLTSLDYEARLLHLCKLAEGKHIVFSTSFSYEDQLITYVIARHNLPISLFTLDTGRLFEETHDVFQRTREAYPHLIIDTYFPDAAQVQALLKKQGTNGFYDSKDNRLACCHVRKVEPLGRALKGADIWISGLRREHSANRDELPVAEMDEARGILKVYPLIDMDEQTLITLVKQLNIPYNSLHDKGFPSIGCAPCTRAVGPGEDARAGRWWWEQDSAQECGLHMVDGKLMRIKG